MFQVISVVEKQAVAARVISLYTDTVNVCVRFDIDIHNCKNIIPLLKRES